MDLEFTPAEEAFRAEVREFYATQVPSRFSELTLSALCVTPANAAKTNEKKDNVPKSGLPIAPSPIVPWSSRNQELTRIASNAAPARLQ